MQLEELPLAYPLSIFGCRSDHPPAPLLECLAQCRPSPDDRPGSRPLSAADRARVV